MAKIYRTKELPDWFSNDNYSAAKDFDAAEWYRQLRQREHLISLLKTSKDESHARAYECAEEFSRIIKFIRGVDVRNARIPAFFGFGGYAEFLAANKRGVNLMTFRDLYDHAKKQPGYEQDPEKWFVAMSKFLSDNLPTSMNADPPLLITGWMQNSYERFVPLLVDQSIPDAQLIVDFTAKLPEIRAANNRYLMEKQFYRPNLKSWARYGILQYLDLWIWQMETGAKIPRGLMALAVSDHRGADGLRSTIKWAKESLGNGLGALLALAATEACASKLKSGQLSEH
ncbi:DUF6387 family protein [Pseudomonas sp.]|uniref:DUF6387 family protein n=1 Tax=Pseudomonas sp. TaxID=306 RepID=UPI003F374D9D